MARRLDIALVQWELRAVPDFAAFAKQAIELLDVAAGADLVVFPENLTFSLLTTHPGWEAAELSTVTRLADYTLEYENLFSAEARTRGQHILAGSHLIEEDGHYLNSGYLFGPGGEILRHAKTHVCSTEAQCMTSEGDELEVWDVREAKVGVMICSEAEIPECATTLARLGAEILLCPSYTFSEHGFWRIRHCAQSRAIENQVYVAQCCTSGTPGGPLPHGWARSAIISPCEPDWPANGLLAEAPLGEQTVIRGTVDLERLEQARAGDVAPTFRDRRRRAEVYRRWQAQLNLSTTSVPKCDGR
jgi:predicted amidohydrolase